MADATTPPANGRASYVLIRDLPETDRPRERLRDFGAESLSEAELLAIDGLYKTAEDMDRKLRGQAVQFWLEGDAIVAEALN